MIKSLELINFGGYRSLQLDFAPLTVIIGGNAYGKSTLLHAIAALMAGVDEATRYAPTDDAMRWLVRGEPLVTIAPSSGGWRELLTRTKDSSAEHLSIKGTFEGLGWLSKAQLTVTALPESKLDVVVEIESNAPRVRPLTVSRVASATTIAHVSTLHPNETYLSDEELHLSSRSGTHDGFVRNRVIRLDRVAIERINCVLRKLSQAEIVSMTTLADAQTEAPLTVFFPPRRDHVRGPFR
jgi:ABC-type cobalamin/Fe3+-siderophores transport system ATPase subunit